MPRGPKGQRRPSDVIGVAMKPFRREEQQPARLAWGVYRRNHTSRRLGARRRGHRMVTATPTTLRQTFVTRQARGAVQVAGAGMAVR
jgi:hypothetical protein